MIVNNYKEDDLLSPHELSVFWNTPVGVIAKLRTNGGGPPFVKFGRQIRYRFADVVAFRGTGPKYKGSIDNREGPWRNKLTKKQEEFCKTVAEGLSRTIAYRNNYTTHGYSRAQLIRSANALLKLDKIKNRIASIKRENYRDNDEIERWNALGDSPITTSAGEDQTDESIYEPVVQYGAGPSPTTKDTTGTSAIAAYGKLTVDADITPVESPDNQIPDKIESKADFFIKPLAELTYQQSKTVDSLINKILKFGALVSLERALLHADITIKTSMKHGHTESTETSNCAAMHYKDIKEERNECREDIRNSLYLALDIAFDDGHRQDGIR
jgi:hypothetical protein